MTGEIVLDTSVAVAHLRGNQTISARLREKLQKREPIFLPVVAWGELLYGAYHSGQPDRELGNLAAFGQSVERLYPDDRTAEIYARIKQTLAVASSPIPENDIWIAAFAVERGWPLVTRDRHFERVPGLQVQNWG